VGTSGSAFSEGIVLQQVAVNIECAVEDAENVDGFASFDYIGDSVVAVKQDAEVAVWPWLIPIA
jgi:hypothetical protein